MNLGKADLSVSPAAQLRRLARFRSSRREISFRRILSPPPFADQDIHFHPAGAHGVTRPTKNPCPSVSILLRSIATGDRSVVKFFR
jgi:hypothetical protein